MNETILSVESVRYPMTGIGRYTLELARQFQQMQAPVSFYTGTKVVESFSFNNNQGSGKSYFFTKIKKKLKNYHLITSGYFCLKEYKEQWLLQNYPNSVFHGTNFICPRFPGKKIVTFHDLTPFLYPSCVESSRLESLKRQCYESLKKADALITVSEASKKDISQYLHYPENKIFVTPLACGSRFKQRSRVQLQSDLKQLGLDFKKYTLFVGTIEPRKNLDTLITAYSNLPNALKTQIPLVICGHYGWNSEKIHEHMERAIKEGWLYYFEYVSECTLITLYSGAKLFCFPSLYEGFGLPVLEAMASGVPVISSDNSSLPEVLGEAGVLIPSLDINLWRNSIEEALTMDLDQEQKMIGAGLIQANRFSWYKCAQETLKVYDKVKEF